MRRLAIITAAVAVLAVGLVAVGGAVTAAQEGDGPVGTFLAKVADKLGVGEDELKGAIKDARLEMIDEAVSDGRLTEEQAEHLRERVEEGDILFPPPGDKRDHPRRGLCQRVEGFVVEAAAQVLGMSKDEVVAELKDGKSLAQVAEGQDMALDVFTDELLGQVEAQLDERVAEGDLTEEQAARILEGIQAHIDRIVNATPGPHGPCPPRRGPGGFDGPRPGPFGDEPQPPEPEAESSGLTL